MRALDALEIRLPSTSMVRIRRVGDAGPGADDVFEGRACFGGRMLAALRDGRVVVERSGKKLAWEEILDLELPDYHALRDAAFRIGAIAIDDDDATCRNCDAPLPARPEDAPVEDFDTWYAQVEPNELLKKPKLPLVPPVALTRGGKARELEMKVVRVREALPFWRGLLDPRGLRLTGEVVKALGIRALGEEKDPRKIAIALDRAPDDAWAYVTTLFGSINYSTRAAFPVVCGNCGTLHDVEAPPDREVDTDQKALRALYPEDDEDVDQPDAPSPESFAPFPDEDAFADAAMRIGRDVYRAKGVANIELEVSFDTPPVDESGEPLLGSYEPLADAERPGYIGHSFLIQLYYRTFERMYEDEPYDVDAEIEETIEHEVEHHLYHLAGHDPMDEEEREEAARDVRRTFGERAVRRARVRGALDEARTLIWFVVVTLALIGFAIGVTWCRGEL